MGMEWRLCKPRIILTDLHFVGTYLVKLLRKLQSYEALLHPLPLSFDMTNSSANPNGIIQMRILNYRFAHPVRLHQNSKENMHIINMMVTL